MATTRYKGITKTAKIKKNASSVPNSALTKLWRTTDAISVKIIIPNLFQLSKNIFFFNEI